MRRALEGSAPTDHSLDRVSGPNIKGWGKEGWFGINKSIMTFKEKKQSKILMVKTR